VIEDQQHEQQLVKTSSKEKLPQMKTLRFLAPVGAALAAIALFAGAASADGGNQTNVIIIDQTNLNMTEQKAVTFGNTATAMNLNLNLGLFNQDDVEQDDINQESNAAAGNIFQSAETYQVNNAEVKIVNKNSFNDNDIYNNYNKSKKSWKKR
jgi:hypothetical protein